MAAGNKKNIMGNKELGTKHAPAGRASAEKLQEQIELFAGNDTVREMAEAISVLLVILNSDRQIVFANKPFLSTFSKDDGRSLLGLRPGEAAGCIYATKGESGCGTSDFCRTCGAVNAILEAQSDIRSEKECQISTDGINALDLHVTATPYHQNGELFTIFSIYDISNEKRRNALERVFFHDVLNTASGLLGLSAIFSGTKDPDEISMITHEIEKATDILIEEIKSQRELSRAERGDLVIDSRQVQTVPFLKEIISFYSQNEAAAKIHLRLDSNAVNEEIRTDPVLLRRVLGNMTKNAIEASAAEGIVSFSCTSGGGVVTFSVHNEGTMDDDIRLQLFRRSFSTKGKGRGIGTYSMKLLGEKYLGGRIWFDSSLRDGTTFFFELRK
jgi:signal transduction histidine kinase